MFFIQRRTVSERLLHLLFFPLTRLLGPPRGPVQGEPETPATCRRNLMSTAEAQRRSQPPALALEGVRGSHCSLLLSSRRGRRVPGDPRNPWFPCQSSHRLHLTCSDSAGAWKVLEATVAENPRLLQRTREPPRGGIDRTHGHPLPPSPVCTAGSSSMTGRIPPMT